MLSFRSIALAALLCPILCCPAGLGSKAFGQNKSSKPKPGPSIVWVNQPSERQLPLPDGVSHRTFHSKLVDQDIGYCVYLPPGYEKSEARYPVIFTLHGNGGNEFTVVDSAVVMQDGIESGRWPAAIMVFPNGGHSTFYKNSFDGKFPIESIFLDELMPHIDATYRTVAKQSHRAIEGFSMGGRGSTRLAVKHPQLFCSLFCQAGNVPALLSQYDENTSDEFAHPMLGADRANYEADDVYALTTKNAKEIKKSLAIQIACGTKDGGHLPTVKQWHAHLLSLGIDHTYIELDRLAHRRTEMMERLRPIWFDHHFDAMARAQKRESNR